MPFDQLTRNRLQQFVTDARTLLIEEFTRQLQNEYGMDPATGKVSDLEKLTHLDDTRRETARQLRVTMDHILATDPADDASEALKRIVREQAFTVLNRLCALRLAEARGLLIDSVSAGYNSKGFKLYNRLAGPALGETGEAYRCYLFSLFDEYAVDLAVLFDRYSPMGRLFPREAALLSLLDLINANDLTPLWGEDETIGWIYQYFNSKEERRSMRDASAVPRNSRELAVRNQFFTPRYVVEFLTDNTLGRIWYEMCQGETRLVEKCRYMVRRPVEVFLTGQWLNTFPDVHEGIRAAAEGDFADLPETPSLGDWQALALMVSKVQGKTPIEHTECQDLYVTEKDKFLQTGRWDGDILTLWYCLFFLQRNFRWDMCEPEGEDWEQVVSLYRSLRQRLQEDCSSLSQEELLNRPVFNPLRRPKDPRDLKVLDPACGSGHFLLYSFDILNEIYLEAWENAESLISEASGRTLHEDYPTAEKLQLAIPALILRHNLHGIDIDPRAVQIAGLSLWLRAQRAWQEDGVKPNGRPGVYRSNLVCAEPMPGEADLLKEFTETLKPRVLGQLVETIFEKMKLVGEAGSLLKVEEEIAGAIEVAREAFNKEILRRKQDKGFLPSMAPAVLPSLFDFADLPNKTQFWDTAEERILDALRRYAEYASGLDVSRRRLFAADTVRGFAFIDLCRKRYDVVLMNPPFGLMPPIVYSYLRVHYPYAYSDLALAFMNRGGMWIGTDGLVGAITSRAFMNVSDAEKFRRYIAIKYMRLLADLGVGVMDDAFVDASAQILSSQMEKFILIKDARHVSDKATPLLASFNLWDQVPSYIVLNQRFESIPKCRLAYDSGEGLDSILSSKNSIDPVFGIARTGASTFEDERFLRLVWEVPPQHIGVKQIWCWIARTTPDFSLFYYPYEIVSKWSNDGAELSERNRQVNGQVAQARQGSTHYFKPGIVFSRRSRPSIAFRIHPQGTIFSSGCGVIFPKNQDDAIFLLGILNSRFVRAAIHTLTTYSYTVGHIRAVLAPNRQHPMVNEIIELTKYLLLSRRKLFRHVETDHYFTPHPCCQYNTLSEWFYSEANSLKDTAVEMVARNEELDKKAAHVLDIPYDIDTEQFGITPKNILLPLSLTQVSFSGFVSAFLSELIGIVVGRWDIRYATGEKSAPSFSDPFASLPHCPLGQLQNKQDLPITKEDVEKRVAESSWNYPIDISWDGILVDDPGHPLDLEGRLHRVMQVIWKDRWEDIEREACEILGLKSLREYFAKPGLFFADHLKRYSKSRRQAPIYWPLSTRSGSYTLWIYYHQLSDQTLYTCVNDFVEPKLKSVAEAAETLRRQSKRDHQDEKEMERLANLEHDLLELRDDLLRLAPNWKPNLNDGVQITAAPLWRLFRLPKWQKTLKETWQKLEKGDYDWAHLAYSSWPDRVREKCKTDKSLAIAHGLEKLFVGPPAGQGKKRGRSKPVDEEEIFDEDQ